MRVLITGGAGTFGSALAERLLDDGHHVDVVDDLSRGRLAALAEARSKPDHRFGFHQMDVTSPTFPELLVRRTPDVVVHLAGDGGSTDRIALDGPGAVDERGMSSVLEAVRHSGVRKIVAVMSAAELYGQAIRAGEPVVEAAPPEPVTIRGITHRADIERLRFYREHHRVEFTVLLMGSVYSPRPGARPSAGVIGGMVDDALAGRPIGQRSKPVGRLDLVFLDDAVDAMARTLDRGDGLVINIGSGRGTWADEAASAVQNAVAAAGGPVGTGDDGGVQPAEDGGGPVLDTTRARIQLGWSAWTALEDGVAAVVAERFVAVGDGPSAEQVVSGGTDDVADDAALPEP